MCDSNMTLKDSKFTFSWVVVSGRKSRSLEDPPEKLIISLVTGISSCNSLDPKVPA